MRQRVRIAKTIQFGLLRKKAYPLTKKRICFFVFRNELQGAVLTLKYRSELVIMIVVCRNAGKRFDKPLFKWLWQN